MTQLRNTKKSWRKLLSAYLMKIVSPRLSTIYFVPLRILCPDFMVCRRFTKKSCPLRPIVSSIGCVTYQAARFIADIIAPLVGSSPQHLKNSADSVSKIMNLTLASGEIIVSYDVKALFTNTPIPDTLRIIRERLDSNATLSDRTTLSVDSIMELLTFCVNTTYFMFKGEIFREENGSAMGSPVSPLVANLYMEWFEQCVLRIPITPIVLGQLCRWHICCYRRRMMLSPLT